MVSLLTCSAGSYRAGEELVIAFILSSAIVVMADICGTWWDKYR